MIKTLIKSAFCDIIKEEDVWRNSLKKEGMIMADHAREWVEKRLFPLSDAEEKMKEFFLKNGRIPSMEESEELTGPRIPEHPLSIFHNMEMQNKKFFSSDFMESHFFPPGVDVFFTKHQCYSAVRDHRHDFYEICYVRIGSCIQTLVSGEKREDIVLHEGDFFFLSPGQMHTVLVDSDSVVLNIGIRKTTFYQTFYNQIPDDTVLGQFFYQQLKEKETKGYLLFETGTSQPVWETYCRFVDAYFHPDRYTQKLLNLELSIMFIQILRQLSDLATAREKKTVESTLVPAIIAWFEDHYADTNIAATSREFGYSPDYMNRIFKRVTGKTLIQMLTEIRMEKAKKLFLYETLSVEEISSLVGYEDVTNFIRNFKKTVGVSPGKYRSEKKEK